jgi:hypothetical protein
MRNKVLISEEQLKRIMEFKANELNVVDVAKQLKNIECTGESVKSVVSNKLNELGYMDVKINFLGHEDETNNLMYSIYTEGPMFVVKAQSTKSETPCLQIIFVQAYDKIQA